MNDDLNEEEIIDRYSNKNNLLSFFEISPQLKEEKLFRILNKFQRKDPELKEIIQKYIIDNIINNKFSDDRKEKRLSLILLLDNQILFNDFYQENSIIQTLYRTQIEKKSEPFFLLFENPFFLKIISNQTELNQSLISQHQEFKQKINETNQLIETKINETNQSIETKINEINQSIETKINETNQLIETKINETNQLIETKINETNQSIEAKINETNQSIETKINETNQSIESRLGFPDFARAHEILNKPGTIIMPETGWIWITSHSWVEHMNGSRKEPFGHVNLLINGKLLTLNWASQSTHNGTIVPVSQGDNITIQIPNGTYRSDFPPTIDFIPMKQ